MHICMYIHRYVCIYASIYTYTHIYIYMNVSLIFRSSSCIEPSYVYLKEFSPCFFLLSKYALLFNYVQVVHMLSVFTLLFLLKFWSGYQFL